MLNSKQLSNLIKKYNIKYNIESQVLYSLYALEQLMKKISCSKYKNYFIVKGGYLLSSLYGLESRATKDLDFTVTNLEIKSKDFEDFISFIEVRDNDESYFEVTNLKDTRVGNINKGCSLSIIYHNGKSKFPLSLDITSGENLLPVEKTEIPLFFEEGSVTLYAYPIEQVLSDKLYTTLAYGKVDDTNSRAKDLYDIYFIFNHVKFDPLKVRESFEKTSMQRNINFTKKDPDIIIDYLTNSEYQKTLWYQFSKENDFAKNISFDTIMNSVGEVSEMIFGKEIDIDYLDYKIEL